MARRKERLVEKVDRIMQEEKEIKDNSDSYGNLYDDPYSEEFYKFKQQQEEEKRFRKMVRYHHGWD